MRILSIFLILVSNFVFCQRIELSTDSIVNFKSYLSPKSKDEIKIEISKEYNPTIWDFNLDSLSMSISFDQGSTTVSYIRSLEIKKVSGYSFYINSGVVNWYLINSGGVINLVEFYQEGEFIIGKIFRTTIYY